MVGEKQSDTQSTLLVNGSNVRVGENLQSTLLSFLRNELQLTGTKSGCANGNCGACTVLIDNIAIQSCQVSVAAVMESNVQTIEHIIQTPLGNRIATALIQHDAAQCGYCLPGIVVAAYTEQLTAETPDPVRALQSNLCRCGTHARILRALNEAMNSPKS